MFRRKIKGRGVMESYAVNEREIDIKQLLLYILDNIKWVILAGLLFGILLGAYGYVKASKSDSPEAASASIQDIIKKNRTKWNGIDSSVTSDAFTEPFPGTYIANAKVYVDFDYSNIEGNDNLDFTAMNNRIQGDIIAIAGSNESRRCIINNLNLHSYDDMKNLSLDDLRYMTSSGFYGANILQIQVADTDEERAKAISNAYATNLIEQASEYETIDSIRILEEAQISYSSVYEKLSVKDYVKKIIKYGFVGAFFGVILVSGICFLIYIFKDTVRTDEDIEYTGFKVFGILPMREEKKSIELKRLACNLILLGKKNVCIVPIDSFTNVKNLNDSILDENNKEYRINITESLVDNPEVVLETMKYDMTILVSTYGKTLVKNLELAKKEFDMAGVDVAGVVLMESRH